MNIIFLGPPASGKGTQAKKTSESLGYHYFGAGEFLREIAKTNDQLRETMETGALVNDQEMTSYITAFLDERNLYDNIIFDGFPRSVEQFNFWQDWLKEKKVSIDLTIYLELDVDEAINRLSARRMDPKTGKIYNLITEPKPGKDIDINSLIQRDDDKPESIKKRFELFESETSPLIEVLKKETKFATIDASQSIEKVWEEISTLLKK